MEGQFTTYAPYPLSRRWPWIAAAVVAILVAAGAMWYFLIRDDGPPTVEGPPEAPFTVTLPAGWQTMPADELAAQPGTPLAVLTAPGGNGVVTINVQPGTNADYSKLSKDLEKRLAERIPDFKLVASHPVEVQAGRALSISYARTKQGTANTLLLVPGSGRLYTLNAAVPAGQTVSAQGAAQILSSFDQ